MKKIVLFTGAGMNVPMGLPTATDFINTINKCDPFLIKLLESHLNSDIKDIEKILYALEEFINGSQFYKHIIKKLNNENSPGFTQVNNVLINYLKSALAFQQIVKHDIYKILRQFNSSIAFRIYINLIKSFKETFEEISLSIFTTNYDLIFEDIVNENIEEFEKLGYKDFYFGFTNKWGKMRFNKSEDFKWSDDVIEYNKLHGSLDWSKDNNGVVVKTGAITLPAEPDDMPLLYPGYKGTPTDEPFISMHNKLYLRLIECDHVYVIGFAFRDPYINSIFEFALRANRNLIIKCFNPASPEDLPIDSNIPSFVRNNPNQFKYIQLGISIKENPLDLQSF